VVEDATLAVTGSSGVPVRALRVEVTDGPDKGGTYTTASEVMSIGTAPSNDLVLTDETVSRYHVDLERREDRIHVRDHGSTNGTRIGSTWLEQAQIAPGTTLRIGRTHLRVNDGDTVTLEMLQGERVGDLLGRTDVMRTLMARLTRAARSESSMLLLGETGTGKEVVAKAIHEVSPRAGRPFETVDCGSMLPTLIASELFGHERGAFTGADDQHIGAFERAHGGTLFLDEIGELPTALQTALLGALERRAFRRVGGKSSISVDVRVICATNRDLRAEVNTGKFRQDLYYRIAVILLRIPPLRDRVDDIALLAEHFLRGAGYDGPIDEVLPAATMEALESHAWPGNVRELRNVVEAALVMGEAPLLSDHPETETTAAPEGTVSVRELLPLPYSEARSNLLHSFENKYLEHLLEKAGGNISLAARRAKMNRSYLTRLLNKHEIRTGRTQESE
jgi:DNA-binding NtrC family response regulator